MKVYNQPVVEQQVDGPILPDTRPRKYYTINFTITFNPHKFSDADTLWAGPSYFANYVHSKQFFHNAWFVFENHKNGRKHLHGQLSLFVPEAFHLRRFDIMTNLSKWCNAKLGLSTFYWDNPTPREGDYKTWSEYCYKENPDKIYYIFRDDPQIHWESRLIS